MFSLHLTKSLQMNSWAATDGLLCTHNPEINRRMESLLIPILRAKCTLLTSITYSSWAYFQSKCYGASAQCMNMNIEQPENRSKIFQPNCISYVNIHRYKQSVYTDQRDENDEEKKRQEKKRRKKKKKEKRKRDEQSRQKKSIFLKTCTSITWHFYSSRYNKQFWHCSIYRTIFYIYWMAASVSVHIEEYAH